MSVCRSSPNHVAFKHRCQDYCYVRRFYRIVQDQRSVTLTNPKVLRVKNVFYLFGPKEFPLGSKSKFVEKWSGAIVVLLACQNVSVPIEENIPKNQISSLGIVLSPKLRFIQRGVLDFKTLGPGLSCKVNTLNMLWNDKNMKLLMEHWLFRSGDPLHHGNCVVSPLVPVNDTNCGI